MTLKLNYDSICSKGNIYIMSIENFKSKKEALLKEKNVVETLAYVQGSLALKPNYIEEESQYEKPTTKRVQILKPSKKIYMGCWQQSYTENDGDGC